MRVWLFQYQFHLTLPQLHESSSFDLDSLDSQLDALSNLFSGQDLSLSTLTLCQLHLLTKVCLLSFLLLKSDLTDYIFTVECPAYTASEVIK